MIDPKFLEDYEFATSGARIAPLVDWSTVIISGADRASFLHNMCTNDIRSLAPGGEREAFICDVKGKIVGHVLVFNQPEKLLLGTVPGQAEKLIAHLDRYIITEDVKLTDATTDLAWWVLIGPNVTDASGNALQILWPGGILGASPRDQPPETYGAAVGDGVWNTLRIESGLPLFGVDFDESNLPQEVGRNSQAINFRKGCYLGQETIARIDALGHVNKQLATVKFAGDEPPAPGAELTAGGQAVGRVTSACWSPTLECGLGLAMLRRGFFEPGAKLECAGGSAEVVATPAVAHSDPRPRAGG